MPPGDVLDDTQVRSVDAAVRTAGTDTGLCFGVHVGASDGSPRAFAEHLLAGLPQPEQGVLVLVDPVVRRIEVCTGSAVARRLDDRACGLAAASMASCFAGGDLAGGLVLGVRMLADHASR